MGKEFDAEMEKVKKLSGYNKERASRLLDDMATAYISNDFDGLDKSLIAVKTAKKAMRAQGIKQDIIDDYFLQRSYLSKTTLKSIVNQSIYTEDNNYIKEVSIIPAFYSDKCTTDLIIDQLKSKPMLLSALQKGMRADHIQEKFRLNNTTLMINFYNKHKDIIDN